MRTRTEPSPAPAGRDRGAALPVAVGFTVMIGAMAAGLTSMVTSGIEQRVALGEIRDRQYAADGAVEQAIAELRTSIDAGHAACGDHWSTTAELNGVVILVDAETDCVATAGADLLPVRQFVGRFTACERTGVACSERTAVVRALVGFETGASGLVLDTAVRSWSVE